MFFSAYFSFLKEVGVKSLLNMKVVQEEISELWVEKVVWKSRAEEGGSECVLEVSMTAHDKEKNMWI